MADIMDMEALYLVDLNETMKKVIEEVAENPTEKVNIRLFQNYGDSYSRSVQKVFSRPDIGDKYYDMSTRYTLNVQRVAAHKASRVTQELAALTNDKLYELKAKELLRKYNRYQAVESNAMVSRARTARQFEQFRAKADLYPNIEWLRTRSADPRELHLSFVGVVRPQDDPFYSENQPGNLYGCKCDWRVTNAPVNDAPANPVQPSVGLEGNPYTTGELITDKHPYMDVPDNYRRKYLNLTYYDSKDANISVLANPKEITTAVNMARRVAGIDKSVIVPSYVPNKSPGLIVETIDTHLAKVASEKTVATAINTGLMDGLQAVAIDLNNIDWTTDAMDAIAKTVEAQQNNFRTSNLKALYLSIGKSAVEVDKALTYAEAYSLIKTLKPA
jgi:hypothetical protein